jgi:hypothetical protein
MAESPGPDLSVMPEHGTTTLDRLDPQALQAEARAIREVQKSVLVEGTDYGIIPGTKKPSLYKAGAEVLLKWARLGYKLTVIETDRDPAGMKYGVTYRCTIHRLDAPDVVIAEGDGYCGYDEAGRDAHTITYQDSGKTREVPKEPWNTIVAMAVKRAMVSATRGATGTSGIFTQDVEDPAYRARNGGEEGERSSNGGGQSQGEHPIITAKFDSKCVVCTQPIKKGEQVVYNKITKKVWHPTCDPRAGDGASVTPAEGEPQDAEPQDADTAPAPAAAPGKMQPGQRKVLVDLVQAIAKMTGNKALTEHEGLQQIGNAVGIDNLDGWAFDNWTEGQAKEAILALTKEMNDFLAAQKAAKEATNG